MKTFHNIRTIAASLSAIGLVLSCTSEAPQGERNPVTGEMAAQSFKAVCLEGGAPSLLSEQYASYDMRYLGGANCHIEIGSSTPYDQIYHAFQAEIPEGGYKFTPVAQGGEGQLGGRNYIIVSRL